jgi:galactokinase/mevalonate kinase-like predicted kinase
MDQYAIAYGGVTFIETGETPKVERLMVNDLPIVVGNSLEERKAVVVLNRIKSQILEKDPVTLEAFAINDTSTRARECIESSNR